MHFPVKICGITSINDAKTSINYGASAIGFIFYKKSPRYICAERLLEWISKVPKRVRPHIIRNTPAYKALRNGSP